MGELKPCPFCGGRKVFLRDDDPHAVWVECDDCQIGTFAHDASDFLTYSDAVDNAVDRWNRRASTIECLEQERDALREALEWIDNHDPQLVTAAKEKFALNRSGTDASEGSGE